MRLFVNREPRFLFSLLSLAGSWFHGNEAPARSKLIAHIYNAGTSALASRCKYWVYISVLEDTCNSLFS